MQIARATDYAIRILVQLAESGSKNQAVSVKRLADAIGISPRYIMKISSILRDNHYIQVIVGPKGGYALDRNASDITLLEILELMERPLQLAHCNTGIFCKGSEFCKLHAIYVQLQEANKTYLNSIRIEDLAAKELIAK